MADREREAHLVARRIQALRGTPFLDRDGKVGRLSYRDMVVLLRSTREAAPEYAEVLRRRGIPVYAELRSGYFASREVKDVLCLFQVLENMRQDIPLAAVLRSPLFGEALSDADLAAIRMARPDLEFHAAVRAYGQGDRGQGTGDSRVAGRGSRVERQQQSTRDSRLGETAGDRRGETTGDGGRDVEADDVLRCKVAERLERLDRWRGEARLRPLAEVIAGIYEETGLLEYVTLLDGGVQCRANLVSLYERARQFGQFSRQGLRRFVAFVSEMIRAGRETTAPTAVGEAQDVVRIMSIHAAKGLEFPVVFVGDLARKFNDLDFNGAIVLDRQGVLGIEARDPQRMLRSDTLVKLLAAGRVRRQNRAEELRVLYVAMTRARERLVLVGTGPKPAERLEEARLLWGQWPGPLPRHVVRYAKCPLDWIVAAGAGEAAASGEAAAIVTHSREETDAWQIADQVERLDSGKVLAALDGKTARTAEVRQVIAEAERYV